MKPKAFSRRTFSKAAIAAPWVLRAQQAPLRARIKVDTERVIGDIDPKLYGNFVEHLGRCIEGHLASSRLTRTGCSCRAILKKSAGWLRSTTTATPGLSPRRSRSRSAEASLSSTLLIRAEVPRLQSRSGTSSGNEPASCLGGMTWPWGSISGSSRIAATRSSKRSEIKCSKRSASSWTSSQEYLSTSCRKSSSKRWCRTSSQARRFPAAVRRAP